MFRRSKFFLYRGEWHSDPLLKELIVKRFKMTIRLFVAACCFMAATFLRGTALAQVPTIHGFTYSVNNTGTINVPTVSNGDFMIWSVTGNSLSPSTPSGWSIYSAATNAQHLYIYTRTASSEPSTYTIGGSVGAAALVMYTLSGAATSIDGSGGNNGSSQSPSVPALSSLSTNCDMLLGIYSMISSTTTFSESGSLTIDVNQPLTGGQNYGVATGHLALTSNSSSAQAGSLGSSQTWYTEALAVAPAVSCGAFEGYFVPGE